MNRKQPDERDRSTFISCPACEREGHWGEIRPHIHNTDDPAHNEAAENIDDILGEHPLTIN